MILRIRLSSYAEYLHYAKKWRNFRVACRYTYIRVRKQICSDIMRICMCHHAYVDTVMVVFEEQNLRDGMSGTKKAAEDLPCVPRFHANLIRL